MKNFLSQFKGWAHWFAGIALSAFTLYATTPAIHDAVNNAVAHNKRLSGFVAIVAPIVTAYLNSKKVTQ